MNARTFNTSSARPRSLTLFVSCSLMAVTGLAFAAGASTRDAALEIEARYRAERQACLQGRTSQDQATCLKEAAAARDSASRNQLDNGERQAELRANQLARCQVKPEQERAACEVLARGQGQESGSVAGGGVIKSVVTRSLGKPGEKSEADAANPPAQKR